jgi:DNA-directed RNA polymerase specialized sigma24 family protein
MDDKYGMTILYRYRDNMSVAEIAEFMGISEKTVYTRLARGKILLSEKLNQEDQ